MNVKMTMAVLCAGVVMSVFAQGAADAEAGILKWKDGKKAAFFMAFDDSCKSHADNAIPELTKRGIPATFYVCPGQNPWQARKELWEKAFPTNSCVVYGNHTFYHRGAKTVEELDNEIRLCQEKFDECYPNAKKPRLISFGQPGGVPWKVTNEERDAVLKKYNLVLRPSFKGIHYGGIRSTKDVLALVDKAIEEGGVGHHDGHGVGGDWGVMPMPMFKALLDKLEACKDVVWATDHITCHKYETERDGAKLTVAKKRGSTIDLKLECTTDPQLYDQPLSLYVKVPAKWKTCTVTQGKKKMKVAVRDGEIRFDAEPVTSLIKIRFAHGRKSFGIMCALKGD